MVAMGLNGSDGSICNPNDNTVLNTGACEVMRNHMQVSLTLLSVWLSYCLFLVITDFFAI